MPPSAARFLAAASLALTTAVAHAHPGHPGHDDDPYRMESPGFLWEQLGLMVPFLALGAALALTSGVTRRWVAGLTAAVVTGTALTHLSEPPALAGMAATCVLHTVLGAVCARMVRAIFLSGRTPAPQRVKRSRR